MFGFGKIKESINKSEAIHFKEALIDQYDSWLKAIVDYGNEIGCNVQASEAYRNLITEIESLKLNPKLYAENGDDIVTNYRIHFEKYAKSIDEAVKAFRSGRGSNTNIKSEEVVKIDVPEGLVIETPSNEAAETPVFFVLNDKSGKPVPDMSIPFDLTNVPAEPFSYPHQQRQTSEATLVPSGATLSESNPEEQSAKMSTLILGAESRINTNTQMVEEVVDKHLTNPETVPVGNTELREIVAPGKLDALNTLIEKYNNLEIEPITSYKEFYDSIFRRELMSALRLAGLNQKERKDWVLKIADMGGSGKDDKFTKYGSLQTSELRSILSNVYNQLLGVSIQPEKVIPSAVVDKTINGELPTVRDSLDREDFNPTDSGIKLEPLVLTHEMRIDQEGVEEGKTFAGWFAEINQMPAGERQYSDFLENLFEKKDYLVHQYDFLMEDSKSKLRRFGGGYTPTEAEKKALIYRASLNGRYTQLMGKIIESESEIIHQLELLTEKNTNFNEEVFYQNIQQYINKIDELFTGVEEFELLITEAEKSEKQPKVEMYKAQFNQLRIEGNSLLKDLPEDDLSRKYLQTLLSVDLVDLIAETEGEEGRLNLERNVDSVCHRRDRIKNTIAYIKLEKDFVNKVEKTKLRVEKLKSTLAQIPEGDMESENGIARMVLSNQITALESLLVPEELVDWSNDFSLRASAENTFDQPSKILAEKLGKIKTLVNNSELELRNYVQKNNFTNPSSTNSAESLENPETIETIDPNKMEVLDDVPPFESSEPKNEVHTITLSSGEYTDITSEKINSQERQKITERLKNRINSLNTMLGVGTRNKITQTLSVLRKPESQKTLKAVSLAALLSLIPTNIFDGGKKFDPTLKDLQSPNTYSSSESAINTGQINGAEILAYLKSLENKLVVTAEASSGQNVNPAKAEVKINPTVPNQSKYTDAPVFQYSGMNQSETLPNIPQFDSGVSITSQSEQLQNTVSPDTLPSFEGIIPLYQVNKGDNFWNLMEGETKAGTMPIMDMVAPENKQALIDLIRDELNTNTEARKKMGTFGDTADLLFAEKPNGEQQEINIYELNKLAFRVAGEHNLLK